MGILNCTYQSLKGWLIGNDVARLDLNNEAGGLKAKSAAPGDDIYALVGTGRRDTHSVTLGLQDFRDKPRKIVPGECTRDTPLDLIPRDLVKIEIRVFSSWGFRGCGSWLGAGLVAGITSGLENRLDTRESIVAADLADRHEGAKAVQKVLPEQIARHIRL
jgi:hypothetical protein